MVSCSDYLRFFLQGSTSLELAKPNPCKTRAEKWLVDKAWGDILALAQLTGFENFDSVIASNMGGWSGVVSGTSPIETIRQLMTEHDENGVELVGRDPFLVAYGRVEPGERTVVSFEVSKPGKQGANRKVPDVCRDFGVPCCSLFDMIEALDFTTAWQQL